jgi:tetratricopeptide (TPR) repeat protein
MEVFPSLTNVRSGQVVYSARKTAGAETSWCRGDMQPISDDQMIDGAIANIISQIRPDIAPYNTVLKATVIEKKDGLSEADAKLFDAAVKSAGKGDLSTACHAWDGLLVTNPSHPWTIYNIGVCAEANGDFAGALTHYEKARSLALKPDNDVAESIARTNRLIAAQKELRRTVKKKR